eukprot:717971_1
MAASQVIGSSVFRNILIPSWFESCDGDGKVIEYRTNVLTHHLGSWTLFRTYEDFRDFHQMISSTAHSNGLQIPDLPSQHSQSPGAICESLQLIMQHCIPHPCYVEFLNMFLEVSERGQIQEDNRFIQPGTSSLIMRSTESIPVRLIGSGRQSTTSKGGTRRVNEVRMTVSDRDAASLTIHFNQAELAGTSVSSGRLHSIAQNASNRRLQSSFGRLTAPASSVPSGFVSGDPTDADTYSSTQFNRRVASCPVIPEERISVIQSGDESATEGKSMSESNVSPLPTIVSGVPFSLGDGSLPCSASDVNT